MDYWSIELKVISASDLKCFNFFRKLFVYAVVSLVCDESKEKKEHQYLQRQKTLVNDDSKKKQERQNLQRQKSFLNDEPKKKKKKKKKERKHLQRQETPVDRVGDGNPEWNHEMHFDLKDNISAIDDDCKQNIFLQFDLRSEGIVLGKKSIGKVQVPIFKDLIDDKFNGTVRFVRYQIRTSDGKPNGVLSFSCKVMNSKTKQKRVVTESPEVESSPGIHFSDAKKVHCPTLEVENQQSRDICYPSLDDVRSTLPIITIPSPKKYHWMPGPYILTPPAMPPHLPPTWEQPACYNPPPSMQIRGTYWNKSEWIMGYGGYTLAPGLWGHSGVGQLGTIEGDSSTIGSDIKSHTGI